MKPTLLLATLLLTACAPAPAVAPPAAPTAPVAEAAPAKAVVRVALSDTAGRRLLADLQGWQASDVARVTLSVTRDGVAAFDPIVLEGAAITAPVELAPLVRGATYDVVGRAYRRVGTDEPAVFEAIDAYEADAATCTTTFTTGATAVTQLDQPLRIQFAPRSYSGAGSTQLGIDDGSVTDADTTPDITLTPDTP